MSQNSPSLGLPYIQPAQAQKHVTHNEAIEMLDVAVQLSVQSATEQTPPLSPTIGDRYLVPTAGAANWGGGAGDIATWDGSGWRFTTPQAGWEAFVLSDAARNRFDGTTWAAEASATMADMFGVNAVADATNRLTVAADATLLNHDGAGHQLKLNKSTLTDTASLLFQTGFSGRAEMGTMGSDAFSIKVTDDGATWTTALSFDGVTGLASGAAVQSAPNDVGIGKLARADYAYGPGNLLGSVAQTAGVPTGAVIERGSNVNGAYVRFADGTQICWSNTQTVNITDPVGAIFRSEVVTWVFPAAFIDNPSMTQGRQNHSSAYWTIAGVTSTTSGSGSAMSFQAMNLRIINLTAFGRWY